MGHLGGEGDALIMLLGGGDGHPPKAHRLQQFLGPVQQTDVVKGRGDEDHRGPVEQIRPAVLKAGEMGARHRVPAQEGKPILLGQGEDACTDLLFGARAVNDQRGLVQQRGQAGHVLDHRFGVGGQQKQI